MEWWSRYKTLQTSDEESACEKNIKMKIAQCLVDKVDECNSEEGMANQIVNNLVTGVVKLILHVLDCVVLRESDVFETAKVLFSDTLIEETTYIYIYIFTYGGCCNSTKSNSSRY